MAILLNALVPSISHALSSLDRQSGLQGTFWDICSTGTVLISPPESGKASEKAPGKPAAYSMVDCPYCLTHAGSTGLLAEVLTSPVLPAGHEIRPIGTDRTSQTIPVLFTPPPRGPPAACAFALNFYA